MKTLFLLLFIVSLGNCTSPPAKKNNSGCEKAPQATQDSIYNDAAAQMERSDSDTATSQGLSRKQSNTEVSASKGLSRTKTDTETAAARGLADSQKKDPDCQ